MTGSTLLLNVAALYLIVGFVFAVAFITLGAGKIDPAARSGSWGFRLLILPGVTALWPLLALRWLKGDAVPPIEKNRHRAAAKAGGRS